MRNRLSVMSLFVLLLSGCASAPPAPSGNQISNLLVSEPAPISPRAQLAIARYNQVLNSSGLKDSERAEFFYQRGIYYDLVGLRWLAQNDFRQALALKPNMAEAYNSIGIHHTQQREFIQAYDAFDATLDINPEYEFAFLNRGIALYYGGRPELATRDLDTFYQKNIDDPYRALWRFIAAKEVKPAEAQLALFAFKETMEPDNWVMSIVQLFLGEGSEAQVMNAVTRGVKNERELTERLCEAYFYLGKYHSDLGNRAEASTYFKLALSTNVYEYIEHRYARLELNMLRDDLRPQITP